MGEEKKQERNPNKFYWDQDDVIILENELRYVVQEMQNALKSLPPGERRDSAEKKVKVVERAYNIVGPYNRQIISFAKAIERLKQENKRLRKGLQNIK